MRKILGVLDPATRPVYRGQWAYIYEKGSGEKRDEVQETGKEKCDHIGR